jgi:hypothetical protein
MQFVIIARDGTDQDAQERRQKARPAHIQNIDQHIAHMIMGVATLDDHGAMNGSVMVVDFPTRQDLDAWLSAEPYVVQDVWEDITVLPCKIGPSFVK